MIRKIFVLVALLLFSGVVLAVAPVVNFSFTPASPSVFQTITFDPAITPNGDLNILFWGFNGDANINYYRSSTTDVNSTIVSDNWSDGDFSSNPTWTTNGGTWSAATQSLVGGSCNGCTIYTDAFMGPNSNIRIHYRERRDTANVQGQFNFLTNSIAATGDGYVLYFDDSAGTGNIVLRKWNSGSLTSLMTVGTQDVGVTYDVNILRTTDGNISVYINGVLGGTVNDTDYTSGSLVLFSTGNSAGGNHTWDDLNVQTIISSTVAIDPDKNETYAFMSPGVKNVCLTAGNSDGNATTCHSVTISGNVAVKVYDENTGLPVPFPKAMFQGNTFTGTAAGVIAIDTPVVAGDFVITLSANNYPPRYFTYRVDSNTSLSFTAYLLDANKGTNIEFVVRDLNALKYPNYFFRIEKDQNVVARVYLDSKALSPNIYLATLVKDYNFFIDINSTAGTNIFSYQNSSVLVNVPRNENTLEVVTPFGINISDLTAIDINNLTTAQTFKIYPNTFHPYKFTIDANALEYFPRYYNLRTLGQQTSKILQPYMLRAIDSGIPATMIVKDSLTSLSLQYYLFEFYTDVNQMSAVLVESPQTDSAGAFIFTTITGKNYFLKIYDPYGDLLKQGQFIASTSTQYFVDLASGIISNVQPTTGVADVNLLIPANNFFFLNDSNNFGIRFITNTTGPTITSVIVSVTTGNTIIFTQTYNPTFPAVLFPNGTSFDANFSTSQNNINTKLTITLVTSSGNVVKTYSFPLKQDSNPTISFPGFGTFCSNIGGLGCAFIWLLIGLFISIGLRFNPIFGVDNNGMFWVMAMWTGVAAFIGLVPYLIGFIAILAGASFWAIRNRPIG